MERWAMVHGGVLYAALLALAGTALRELAPALPLWAGLLAWAPGPLVFAWLSTRLEKEEFGFVEYLSSPVGVVASWLAFAGVALPLAALLG